MTAGAGCVGFGRNPAAILWLRQKSHFLEADGADALWLWAFEHLRA